jgi:hypothetical protein
MIWSHVVTGWQAALLGVLNKSLEPEDPAVRMMNNVIEDFARWANQPGPGRPEFPRPAGCTDDCGT